MVIRDVVMADRTLMLARLPKGVDFLTKSAEHIRGCGNPDRNRATLWRGLTRNARRKPWRVSSGAQERLAARLNLAFMPGAVRHVQSRKT